MIRNSFVMSAWPSNVKRIDFMNATGLCKDCIYYEIRRREDGEFPYHSQLFGSSRLTKGINVQRLTTVNFLEMVV